MSLHETLRCGINRCSAAGQQQKDAAENQILEKHRLPHKKMGGIDFTYPAHFTKPPLRQGQRPGASSVRRCVEHSEPARDRSSARRPPPAADRCQPASHVTCSPDFRHEHAEVGRDKDVARVPVDGDIGDRLVAEIVGEVVAQVAVWVTGL